MAGCGPRRAPRAYRARDGGAGESVLGREAGREGQGGTDSDHGETSGRAGQGLCVFRSQAQALPLGVWTLGTTLSGVG